MSIFHWDSALFRSAMNRPKEVKEEKSHEDDSEFNWDSLDPDEPAAAETLAALDAITEDLCDSSLECPCYGIACTARLSKRAMSSAWWLIRSLQGALKDGRMHQAQLEDELAKMHERGER